MTAESFLASVSSVEGASVAANPFVELEGGRKATYTVPGVKTLDNESEIARAISANGCAGKISSGAAKGARRGIPGSFKLPAKDESGEQFLKAWEAAGIVEMEETVA